jgi:predicted Fe-Mo cluster-binding NifX family protein
MKIVMTTSLNSLDGTLDKRFGRARGFLIYDTQTQTHEFMDNQQNIQAAQGAGIQSAQNIIATGAQCVISGQYGPKALRVLKSADMKVYSSEAATVKECIEQFNNGTLQEVQG